MNSVIRKLLYVKMKLQSSRVNHKPIFAAVPIILQTLLSYQIRKYESTVSTYCALHSDIIKCFFSSPTAEKNRHAFVGLMLQGHRQKNMGSLERKRNTECSLT